MSIYRHERNRRLVVRRDRSQQGELDILAKAARNSPGEPTDRFMATVVRLLPERFLKRDPGDAVADLLDDASPSLNAVKVR